MARDASGGSAAGPPDGTLLAATFAAGQAIVVGSFALIPWLMGFRNPFQLPLLALSLLLMACACVALGGRWRAVLAVPPTVVVQAVLIWLWSEFVISFAPGCVGACVVVAWAWTRRVGSSMAGASHPAVGPRRSARSSSSPPTPSSCSRRATNC